MHGLKGTVSGRTNYRVFFGVLAFIALVLFAGQTKAIETEFFGGPLAINGYVNQSIQFGIAGDKYDTMQGFQQGITQALLELEYYFHDELKLFVTGLLFKDWAYNIYDSNDDWGNNQPPKDPVGRRFKSARNEMSLRTDYEDVLKECHITWTFPGFNIRIGKQIVSWGRMDGVRIMDQINPIDRRLGPSDVEFETTIIPIWLAKVEYYPQIKPPFLDQLGIEFTFNPNTDFIGSKLPATGNDTHGIWASDKLIPALNARTGSLIKNYEEPDNWSDGREYGLRLKGTFPDATYFTLNFFDGVDNSPVIMPDFSKGTFGLNYTGLFDDKNREIVEPYMTGFYADKRYAGFTLSRDFEEFNIKALGGVAPLVRVEALYEFDSYFTLVNSLTDYRFEEYDAIYWGMGVDWKFKWNLLNPRRYFSLVPQFSHRHIRDYPSGTRYLQDAGGGTVSENNYSFSIRMDTWYLHDKLQPFVYFQRDISQDMQHKIVGSAKSDMWLFRVTYKPNDIWKFKTQLTLLDNDGNKAYRGMDHKDNISFTVQYQF